MHYLAFIAYLELVVVSAVSINEIGRLFDESVRSQLSQSRLQVQLESSSRPGIVRAVLRNQGLIDAYFDTGSIRPARGVQLYDINDEPVQPHSLYNQYLRDSSAHQKVSAGGSVSLEIDIGSTYALSHSEGYFIQAGGFVPFYLEGQHQNASNAQSAIFEAEVFAYQAPATIAKTNVKASLVAMVPSIVVSKCSDTTMQQKMTLGIESAIRQSNKAIAYVETGTDRTIMMNFFKSDDASTRKTVTDRLRAVVNALQSTSGPGVLECQGGDGSGSAKNAANYCAKSKAMAITEAQSGRVTLCNAAKPFPADFKRCDDGNWGGTIVHEMTHSGKVYRPNTIDAAYRLAQVKALSTSRALLNAQSYNFLVDSVSQGRSC